MMIWAVFHPCGIMIVWHLYALIGIRSWKRSNIEYTKYNGKDEIDNEMIMLVDSTETMMRPQQWDQLTIESGGRAWSR